MASRCRPAGYPNTPALPPTVDIRSFSADFGPATLCLIRVQSASDLESELRVENSVRVKQAVGLADRSGGVPEMHAAYFTINVKPNDMEKFLEACIENGQASVRDEPDCYRFEILRDKNNQNRICFMEVFKDEQALETHWETPHFTKMWQTIENMVDGEIDQTDMEMVHSSDDSLGS